MLPGGPRGWHGPLRRPARRGPCRGRHLRLRRASLVSLTCSTWSAGGSARRPTRWAIPGPAMRTCPRWNRNWPGGSSSARAARPRGSASSLSAKELAALTTRALVYGDIDLNLIDGSAIWLQSVTQALARAGCAVTLVLKAPVSTSRLIAPLLTEPGVTVRRPFEEHLVEGPGPLRAADAPELLARLDAEAPHDLVVLRGRAVTAAAAKGGLFAGRLWPYLTDVPQSVPGLTTAAAEELGMIAAAARYLLCQTEELRCFLEGSIPAACGKCVLLPPILA